MRECRERKMGGNFQVDDNKENLNMVDDGGIEI